ncbi:hypothetical protein ILUMI_01768 [Ignelater luminosus]|uniref:pseudouridine 5'-phosphatase n=1 Tax=Ignelater luminosus TaxID=2038154 RepID=A0A8K0DDY2_IGNLU|nr:hypothetical protein ILUMI_01768 [Ignelater luminosus]
MTFKKVTHVIFDMDGLLLDSEKAYDKMISAIARKYGKEYTLETRMKIMGTPEPVTAKIAVSEMSLPITPEQFLAEYEEMGKIYLQNPPLFEGAEKLVRHLHKHNIPIALATSSSKESVAIKTKDYTDLFSLFHHKVMGSSDPEVKRGKPNPDIYLVCASRFPDKPSPEQCLVLEDAPNGVVGAVRAGMQVVMVPSKEVNEELRKPATLAIEALVDFKPELFGLPPFED